MLLLMRAMRGGRLDRGFGGGCSGVCAGPFFFLLVSSGSSLSSEDDDGNYFDLFSAECLGEIALDVLG